MRTFPRMPVFPMMALSISFGLLFTYASTQALTPTHKPPHKSPSTLDLTLPVINHPATQENPDISGQRVVWQDARFGPTEIFMADLVTHQITNLTQTDTWEVQPDLDGDILVWKDGYNKVGVHGLNLATNQKFTVTEGHNDTSRPRLSGHVVVWADNRAGDTDWNIYGYDLTTQKEFVISAAPGNQMDPQIDGNLVVWWDYQEHIYLYDVNTGQTTTIVGTHGVRLPDVSAADQWVVWQDMRSGNWDIYGYDLAAQTEQPVVVEPDDQTNVTIAKGLVAYQSRIAGLSWTIQLHPLADKQTFPLTDNPAIEAQPAIDGDTVVWQDNRNHQLDIYAFTWKGTVPTITPHTVSAPTHLQVGALPGGKIILHWLDNSPDETGLKIERAQGITGTTWTEIANLPADATTYTDQPSVLGESYWYRVAAYNTTGVSAYSNESFNSTFADAPSPDELYLMTLINEARADPAAAGYASYPVAPPLAYHPFVAASAHSHSQSILNSGFQFGHCDPSGRCATERAQAVGYNGSGCGENLIVGDTGAAAVAGANRGFLDSLGHRDNMLDANYQEFGVGHTYDRRKGDQNWHGQFTEVFCGHAGVTPPMIPSGAVEPAQGKPSDAFTYVVNFYSAAGRAPQKAEVVIDDVPHALTRTTGTAAYGTYRYTTQLGVGQHRYYFQFQDGVQGLVKWPVDGAVNYPNISDPTGGGSSKFVYLPLVKR